MINFSNYIKCKDEKDVLKEKYLNEDIFLVGTKIINGDKVGEIIRRGPNYVISLDENQKVFRSWITDIKEYVEEKPKRINKYRNYQNSRDTMNSVNSTVFFLGMLPEHSYKIRRAVERTILEGMDYDTAIETISEDLKSDFLVSKAVEYLDIVISEATQPNPIQAQVLKAKETAAKTVATARVKAASEKAAQIQKQAQKSAKMSEEQELDESEKWIQKAVKHKGALHRQLGVPAGENIPAGKLEKAAHAKGKLGKRARLAQTLAGLHKEATDQDGDGDNDFADVMIARMTASGKKTKKQAIAATKDKPYNKEGYDWKKHSHFEHGQHAAKQELKTGKKAEPYHTPGSKEDKEWKRGYNSVMKMHKEEQELEERRGFDNLNPNLLMQKRKEGSRAAAMHLRKRGLSFREEEEIQEDDPCWDTHKMVGMQIRGGKKVPRCVPKKSVKEQEQVGGVSSGFGFQGVYGASGKKYRKEEFSDWRSEISLSENLVEKVVKGNVIVGPSTDDCPNCGERLDKTYTCPNCDTNELRTRYHEEDYEIIEKHLSKMEKEKKESIIKKLKDKISYFKDKYGDRWKEVMYAIATKQAMAEDIEELDEAEDRYYILDKVKNVKLQSGMSEQSAKAMYQRLIKSGRSSKEIAIRKLRNK